MSSKAIKELQEDVLNLKKALAKLGKEGITRQEFQSRQIEELKTVIVEAHEKEKKRLMENMSEFIKLNKELLSMKDAEIAELKKNQKP